MEYWIGQGFGLVATALDISLPQFKKKWQMLALNIATNAMLGLNLLFLGEIGSGIFLFAVGIIQATMNLKHTLQGTKPSKFENILFICMYICLGFYGLVSAPGFVPEINSKNLLELLPILGAMLNYIFVSTWDANKARKYMVVCTAVWTVYHASIGSASFFGSLFSVISGTFAVFKHRKNPAKSEQE